MRFNILTAALSVAMIPTSYAQYMGGPCSGGVPGNCMDIRDCLRRMKGYETISSYVEGYCPGLPRGVVCCQLPVPFYY